MLGFVANRNTTARRNLRKQEYYNSLKKQIATKPAPKKAPAARVSQPDNTKNSGRGRPIRKRPLPQTTSPKKVAIVLPQIPVFPEAVDSPVVTPKRKAEPKSMKDCIALAKAGLKEGERLLGAKISFASVEQKLREMQAKVGQLDIYKAAEPVEEQLATNREILAGLLESSEDWVRIKEGVKKVKGFVDPIDSYRVYMDTVVASLRDEGFECPQIEKADEPVNMNESIRNELMELVAEFDDGKKEIESIEFELEPPYRNEGIVAIADEARRSIGELWQRIREIAYREQYEATADAIGDAFIIVRNENQSMLLDVQNSINSLVDQVNTITDAFGNEALETFGYMKEELQRNTSEFIAKLEQEKLEVSRMEENTEVQATLFEQVFASELANENEHAVQMQKQSIARASEEVQSRMSDLVVPGISSLNSIGEKLSRLDQFVLASKKSMEYSMNDVDTKQHGLEARMSRLEAVFAKREQELRRIVRLASGEDLVRRDAITQLIQGFNRHVDAQIDKVEGLCKKLMIRIAA